MEKRMEKNVRREKKFEKMKKKGRKKDLYSRSKYNKIIAEE
jgi:hypothetical protein